MLLFCCAVPTFFRPLDTCRALSTGNFFGSGKTYPVMGKKMYLFPKRMPHRWWVAKGRLDINASTAHCPVIT